MAFLNSIKADRGATCLVIVGLLSEIIYVAYFLKSFFLPKYYSVPFLDIGKLSNHGAEGAWIFIAIFSALFLGYYVAYRHSLPGREMNDSGNKAIGIWIVFGFAALFNLTLVFIYPVGAADVFDYIFHGRILVHYGLNPFQSLIADFPSDPFYFFAAWKFMPSVYGPIWVILSAIPSIVAGDDLFLNIVLYKALVALLFLLTAWLAYRSLRRLAPHYALAGTLLLAWNPLALYETAGNGHNDIAMAFFSLVGIYFLARGQRTRAIIGATAAGLMKFVGGLLAPFFLVAYLKQLPHWTGRIQFVAKVAITCTALTIALYAPFWIGPQMLGIEKRQAMFTDSVPTVVMLMLTPSIGQHEAETAVGGVAAALFAVMFVWRIIRVDHRPIELLTTTFDLLFLYLLVLCQWFQPWYLLWILPLAAVIPRLDIANKAMLFSYTALWVYFVYTFIGAGYQEQLGLLAIEVLAAAMVHTLPICYWVWCLVANRRYMAAEASFGLER